MHGPNVYDRRLIFFSGKGGVGKTTISSAFAYSCAQRGERTLLMQINTKDRLSGMFGSAEVGQEIVEIEDNLFAVNCTPASAMQEYAMMMLRVRIVYKAIFENRIMSAFLAAIPGLNELVMLGKAYFHAIEKVDGRHVWDKVVVDAPATGHGIYFLQIPQVITSILSTGHMYEEAMAMMRLIGDESITALNIVTLAEEMPVNETRMLYEVARDKLGIPLGYVIANAVYPPLLDLADIDLFDQPADDFERAMLEAARFRVARTTLQQRYLKELHEATPLPVAQFGFVFAELLDFVAIRDMAQSLHDQMTGGQLAGDQIKGRP